MSGNDSVTRTYLSIRDNLSRAVAGIVPPKEVEDIVQETYVRVCKVQDDGEIQSPKSFLFRIARNLALDHAKRAETRLSDSLDADMARDHIVDDSVDSTYQTVVSHEKFSLFCEAVRCLPAKCRRVFVLKKVYGLTQREIARELNIGESTVEKHIARGVRHCADYMAGREANAQSTNSAGNANIHRFR